MNDDLILNVGYFCVALCIIIKVAWIARMTGHIAGPEILGLRFAGGFLALIILGKALGRFAGGDAATLVDVGRELTLCIFLAFAIAVLKLRTGHW